MKRLKKQKKLKQKRPDLKNRQIMMKKKE